MKLACTESNRNWN